MGGRLDTGFLISFIDTVRHPQERFNQGVATPLQVYTYLRLGYIPIQA